MKIEQIQINKIKPDPNQPRKIIEELSVNTFKTQGTINPIEIDEKNMIVTGELRWRSAKKAGLKTIPCRIIKGITKEQRLERQLVENFNRKDMTVYDAIKGIKSLINMGTSSPKHGNDKLIQSTATKLGISRRWLHENLKFEEEAIPELKTAVKEKKMSVKVATEIMRLPEPKQQKQYAKEFLDTKKRGLTQDSNRVAEDIARINKAPKREFDKRLLQTGSWIQSFRGSVTDSRSQMERTFKILAIATKFIPAMDDKQKERLEVDLDRFIEMLEKGKELAEKIQEKIE